MLRPNKRKSLLAKHLLPTRQGNRMHQQQDAILSMLRYLIRFVACTSFRPEARQDIRPNLVRSEKRSANDPRAYETPIQQRGGNELNKRKVRRERLGTMTDKEGYERRHETYIPTRPSKRTSSSSKPTNPASRFWVSPHQHRPR